MAFSYMELIEAASGKKRPPKSQIDRLVQAFALKIYSAQQEAPVKIQQKFYDQFQSLHAKMEKKYPYIDMESDSFWSSLKSQAEKWWNGQAVRGAGKHW